jgi:hypothetical protein
MIGHRNILILETNSWQKQKQKGFQLSKVSDEGKIQKFYWSFIIGMFDIEIQLIPYKSPSFINYRGYDNRIWEEQRSVLLLYPNTLC